MREVEHKLRVAFPKMGPNHTTELSIGKLLLLLHLTGLKTRAVCSATTINPANATSASGSWPYRPLPTSEMKASRMDSVIDSPLLRCSLPR